MFIFIVVLMSISLIGIIAVQLYWINNAVESRKEQFKNDVQKSLGRVAERINEKEERLIEIQIQDILEHKTLADNAQVKNYLFQQIDTTNNTKITFGTTVLEENFEIPLDFLDDEKIIFTRVTGKKDFFQSKFIKSPDNIFNAEDVERFSFLGRMKSLEKSQFTQIMKDFKRVNPLNKRVSNRELNATIKEELVKNNIHLDFKYGVYTNEGLATKLKSGYYTININESYEYPLLYDSENKPEYNLFVTFPSKNEHILSGISSILLLSLFFIFVIIIAFSSSLYQLIKQKKISEIKTDFINNMTHEFKTPIATINLALDSIKNPKIIGDEDKVKRYLKMIKDENNRMHAQVENVLRISKLEKNELNISKDQVDLHELILDAITHIELIVENRNGYINTNLDAKLSSVLANETHFTNVIVNILDNAVKYTNGKPEINMTTENIGNNIILKISDRGSGMTKSVSKRVFEKFYREHTGDVHNVKGHGLGLAYVKRIVDDHSGHVSVESEKGHGSTFIIKLPLIS